MTNTKLCSYPVASADVAWSTFVYTYLTFKKLLLITFRQVNGQLNTEEKYTSSRAFLNNRVQSDGNIKKRKQVYLWFCLEILLRSNRANSQLRIFTTVTTIITTTKAPAICDIFCERFCQSFLLNADTEMANCL